MKKLIIWIYFAGQMLVLPEVLAQEHRPGTSGSGHEGPQAGIEAQLIAYRDTIRILKDGIFSYETLLKEQQELIDTLLNKLEGKPGKGVTRKPADVSQAAWKDSVAYLKEVSQSQAAQLASLQAERDSLKKALAEKSSPREATPVAAAPATPVSETAEAGDARRWQAQFAAAREAYQREMKTMQERYYALEKAHDQLRRQVEEQEQALASQREQLKASAEALNQESGRTHETLQREGAVNRRLRTELKFAQNQLKAAEEQAKKDKANLLALYRECESVRQGARKWMTELEKTEKQLVLLQEANRNLEGEKNRRMMEFLQASNEVDSVLRLNAGLQARNQQLLLRQDSLLAEIELLSPYTESARTRRRVYQQQLENLTLLQNRLPRQEQALNAREKLLQQRESIIEKSQPESALADAIQLNEKLSRENLFLRQQIAGSDRGPSPVFGEIYSGTLLRGAEATPAFCLDTRLSELALREHIEHYFLEHRQQPVSKYPLTYQRVKLSEPGGALVKVTFEIGPALSNGWRQMACLVQGTNGRYLDASQPGLSDAIARLLEEILP